MSYGSTTWEYSDPAKAPAYSHKPACFSHLRYTFKNLKAVDFLADVEGGINEDQLAFWLWFCRKMFGGLIGYSAAIIPPGSPSQLHNGVELVDVNKRTRVLFRIPEIGDITYGSLLCALTAFRLIDEFPASVKEFYKVRGDGDSDEGVFQLFQQLHMDAIRKVGKYAAAVCAYGHHHLLSPGYGTNQEKPVTLAQFRAKIKDKTALSVFAHFTSV